MKENLIKKVSELPVSQGIMEEVRDELKSEISGVRADLKKEFTSLRGEVAGVKSEVSKVLSAVHRVQALVEEQNRNNRYVMDGYMAISERQDRLEDKVDFEFGEIKGILKLI